LPLRAVAADTDYARTILLRTLAAAQLKMIVAEQHDSAHSTVITRARIAHARAMYLRLASAASNRNAARDQPPRID
jgi:hypothetical protein